MRAYRPKVRIAQNSRLERAVFFGLILGGGYAMLTSAFWQSDSLFIVALSGGAAMMFGAGFWADHRF